VPARPNRRAGTTTNTLIGAKTVNTTTPDRIDYQLTRAFVAIELQRQDRIDQAIDRLAIRLLLA
jgi:hypothetical protein